MLYAVITVLLTNANSLEMPHSSSSLQLESTEGAVQITDSFSEAPGMAKMVIKGGNLV